MLLAPNLLLPRLLLASGAQSAPPSCSWPGSASSNTSCAPLGASLAPTTLAVTVSSDTPSDVYTDITAFSYADAPLRWPGAPRQDEPGRRVLVAAADIRDWEQPWCFRNGTCASRGPQGVAGGGPSAITIANNVKRGLAIVDEAGAKGADVVQLPEEWKYSWVTNDRQQCPHSVCAEPLKGETYQLLRSKAVEHQMHIVYGTRENATDGAVYNTAVVLDRKGEIAATCAHDTPPALRHSKPAASL